MTLIRRTRTGAVISFEAYGVSVAIASPNVDALEALCRLLEKAFPPGELRHHPSAPEDRRFSIRSDRESDYVLFEGRRKVTGGNDLEIFLNFLTGRIRLLVAEHAREHVFVHAGVVGWNDFAIIIPGASHSGKTSLVKALVESGAVYYSDEFAVIGTDGLVRPFATDLAVRVDGGSGRQTDVPVESVGGVRGRDAIRAGMVLFSQYEAGREFSFSPMSHGEGLLTILPHTIPVTERPEFSLKLLNLATSRAIILKSLRGEADTAAQKILKLLEKHMS